MQRLGLTGEMVVPIMAKAGLAPGLSSDRGKSALLRPWGRKRRY